MPLIVLKLESHCKSFCDHQLELNVLLQSPFHTTQALPDSVEGISITVVINKSRGVQQVEFPCEVGILILIGAYIFLNLGGLGGISDGFSSDEVN